MIDTVFKDLDVPSLKRLLRIIDSGLRSRDPERFFACAILTYQKMRWDREVVLLHGFAENLRKVEIEKNMFLRKNILLRCKPA